MVVGTFACLDHGRDVVRLVILVDRLEQVLEPAAFLDGVHVEDIERRGIIQNHFDVFIDSNTASAMLLIRLVRRWCSKPSSPA